VIKSWKCEEMTKGGPRKLTDYSEQTEKAFQRRYTILRKCFRWCSNVLVAGTAQHSIVLPVDITETSFKEKKKKMK